MFRFRVRVCLLQFYVCGEVFLVDALAPLDLGALWPRLAKKHLVMHGSDFDLRLLYDFCRFRAKSLFDTMLAAQLLGRSRIGLASLIEDNFGVKLDKDGPEGQLVPPAHHAEAPRLRRPRRVVPAGASGHPRPRAEEAGPPRLDGAAVQGADRGGRDRIRPTRRERLAHRQVRAPARARPDGPARRMALAPGAGPAPRHAPVQGLLE